MAGERNYLDPEEAHTSNERARSAIFWGLMVGVGFLVWELTDRTGLAASVACLKFGWEKTATGLYLLRKDPNRSRGWTCCTFHIARGCARFGWSGFVVSLAAEEGPHIIRQWQGLPPAPRAANDVFLNVLLLGMCGLTGSVFLSGVATWLALSAKQRVWIDPTTRTSRTQRLWPPRPHGRNRVWLHAVVGTLALTHVFGMLAMAMAVGWWLSLVTVPCSLAVGWRVARRISALSPVECWPELPPMLSDDAGREVDGTYAAHSRLRNP
jgi:hypothetical protein